jgi:hypothetical protein
LAGKVADMSVTCRRNSQMLAHLAKMHLSWRHKIDPTQYYIHPFLLRVPEVHTENSVVSSDILVMVGVAERYLVSDNAKKIRLSHD